MLGAPSLWGVFLSLENPGPRWLLLLFVPGLAGRRGLSWSAGPPTARRLGWGLGRGLEFVSTPIPYGIVCWAGCRICRWWDRGWGGWRVEGCRAGMSSFVTGAEWWLRCGLVRDAVVGIFCARGGSELRCLCILTEVEVLDRCPLEKWPGVYVRGPRRAPLHFPRGTRVRGSRQAEFGVASSQSAGYEARRGIFGQWCNFGMLLGSL